MMKTIYVHSSGLQQFIQQLQSAGYDVELMQDQIFDLMFNNHFSTSVSYYVVSVDGTPIAFVVPTNSTHPHIPIGRVHVIDAPTIQECIDTMIITARPKGLNNG